MKSPTESLLHAIYWVKFTHREECPIAAQHNLKYTRCCPAVAEAVRILERLLTKLYL